MWKWKKNCIQNYTRTNYSKINFRVTWYTFYAEESNNYKQNNQVQNVGTDTTDEQNKLCIVTRT